MSERSFRALLESRWDAENFVCVGLDTTLEDVSKAYRWTDPGNAEEAPQAITRFNRRAIVEATAHSVCAYKLNPAFYLEQGHFGLDALERTIAMIRAVSRHVPVILDGKFGDIRDSNASYAEFAFDRLGADAVTVHPYPGAEALDPFLARAEKDVFVLCRTSDPCAEEFQDRAVSVSDDEADRWGLKRGTTMPLYQLVAYRVSREWNKNGNCALVVGATHLEALRRVRKIVGDMPLLIPGVGRQGGDVEKIVSAGKDSRGRGMIVNSSRDIIFASKGAGFATAALRALINQYRLAQPKPLA